MRSPHLPEPAGRAAPPAPARPLTAWSTAGWALLAFCAWLAAEALVLIVFLVRWFARNPGVPIDVDKISHNGYVVSIAAIVSMAVQCGVVLLAVRRARQPIAEYLGLVRRPHVREVVFCLASVRHCRRIARAQTAINIFEGFFLIVRWIFAGRF